MRFKKIISVIIVLGGIIILFSNNMGILRWYNLKNERKNLQSEINKLIKKEKDFENKLNQLTYDTTYIKQLAQEKFHMVKSGEKVFRVIDKRKVK